MAIDESRNGKPSGIQLVQVEGFLEVARRGSVSRAAEVLFITQPTLTARLQGLERELGTPLFLRTSHGMRLTDAGRAWIPFAERALRALVDGRDALEQVMTASAGHLMIAAAPAVSTYVLPELLQRFVEAHPRVEVSVRTGPSGDSGRARDRRQDAARGEDEGRAADAEQDRRLPAARRGQTRRHRGRLPGAPRSQIERATGRVSTSNLPIGRITTIDWTYIGSLDSFLGMDREIRSQDEDTEGTVHECECPEPCNCDHENE